MKDEDNTRVGILSKLPAHKDTRYDINKCTKKATVFPFVKENADPVDLCCRDNKHDNSNKYSEVAVCLTSPIDYKLAIFFTSLPS